MAKIGFGAIFQLSPTTITGTIGKLAEVESVGLPNASNDAVDVTNHDSAGGVQEFIPDGVIKLAPLPVVMNYVPGSTSDVSCETAVASKALYFFLATVPTVTGTPATWTYSGKCVVISYVKPAAGTTGKMSSTLTVQPSGVITKAAGS